MLTTILAPPPRWMRSFGRARWPHGDCLIHPDGRRLIAADRHDRVRERGRARGAVVVTTTRVLDTRPALTERAGAEILVA